MGKTLCLKLKKITEQLEHIPVPGVLGKTIYKKISKTSWLKWVQYQTILINEYRLNLLDSKSQKFLTEEMKKYFFKEKI